MKFTEFLNKWVSTDDLRRAKFQGKITFNGTNALFVFPNLDDDEWPHLFGVNLIGAEYHLENNLTEIDSKLNAIYK